MDNLQDDIKEQKEPMKLDLKKAQQKPPLLLMKNYLQHKKDIHQRKVRVREHKPAPAASSPKNIPIQNIGIKYDRFAELKKKYKL